METDNKDKQASVSGDDTEKYTADEVTDSQPTDKRKTVISSDTPLTNDDISQSVSDDTMPQTVKSSKAAKSKASTSQNTSSKPKRKRKPSKNAIALQQSLHIHTHKQMVSRWDQWKKIAHVSVASLIIGLGLVWLFGIVFLMRFQFSNGQTINVKQPSPQLIAELQHHVNSYSLLIQYPHHVIKQYSLASTGFSIDVKKSTATLRSEQHNWYRLLTWWNPIPIVMQSSLNYAVFYNFVVNHATVVEQPAQDATIAIVNGKIQVTSASNGKEYGLSKPFTAIQGAIESLQPSPLSLQTLASNPAITTAQLAPSEKELTKTINQTVVFHIGSQIINATPDDIAQWIEITPNDKNKHIDITVNSGKVLSYINKFASTFLSFPRDQVDIVLPDGSTQTLISGQNGMDILDKQSVATQVASSLLTGKGINISMAVSFAPFKTITTQTYPKWIEVDTTSKRMYTYEQNNLIRTFLISAGAPATPTVTGTFSIYAKYPIQNMTGENVDGSSYFQPNVQWINYFYRDYAIHGNYWRPLSYFGNVNSSHGCVGVVNSDAEWIYNWAPIGTPVIVHT